jgi:patatin-related protein
MIVEQAQSQPEPVTTASATTAASQASPAEPGVPAPDTAEEVSLQPDASEDEWDRQQIRVGVVLNGGVSLAVWMSGVVLELHHLGLASQHRGPWDTYGDLLNLLRASARIDVIAGTSAGGLNGAFLALGQVHHRDFTVLRDMWRDAGSFEELFRPAPEKNPPSLMRGDDFFLVKLRDALSAMLEQGEVPARGAKDAAAPANSDATSPVELILTGTLWDGRTSSFTDDMGVSIVERDYDATFHFSTSALADITTETQPPQTGSAIVEQLAQAARCTASFPAAFEPHWIHPLDGVAEPGRWLTTAGEANFAAAQYVIDGGVLLNKPIRPAMDAIYQQPGREEVRRVLAYVVPDPGGTAGTSRDDTEAAPAQPPTPVAGDVLLSMLTRMRSTDSVSRELAEIQSRNAVASERRRARARLSGVLATAGASLADNLWFGYVAERIDQGARTVGGLLAAGQRRLPTTAESRWSEKEIVRALERLIPPSQVSWIPIRYGSLDDALEVRDGSWPWGQSAVVRLADTTVDVLRRTLALTPAADTDENRTIRQAIVAQRVVLAPVLEGINAEQANLRQFWLAAPVEGSTGTDPIPGRVAGAVGDDADTTKLDNWLKSILQAWDDKTATTGQAGQTHRRMQYGQALALASALLAVEPHVRAALAQKPRAPFGDVDQLETLIDWLVPAGGSPEDVLTRMLRLEVVLVATGGALANVEQTVELVQMSCLSTRTLTGIQLHHFGAFYRPSWRVNDWLRGRRDGAKQIVQFLLSPTRLRKLGRSTGQLVELLHTVAVESVPEGGDRDWLEREQWDPHVQSIRDEVTAALAGSDKPLRVTAAVVAAAVELNILRSDLDVLADALRGEDGRTSAGQKWLASYPGKDSGINAATLPAERVWQFGEEMNAIGADTIRGDAGSDLFARTVSHAAAVTASAFAATPKIAAAKPLATTIKAVRGYLLAVWAMVAYLTSGSRIGPRVVAAAVGVGGVLLAITLFVPAVPVGLVIAGAVLVLAGATAAALRTNRAHSLGWRLAGTALIALLALGGLVWWQIHKHGNDWLIGTGIKVGVGLLIVCIGWILATAKPDKHTQ